MRSGAVSVPPVAHKPPFGSSSPRRLFPASSRTVAGSEAAREERERKLKARLAQEQQEREERAEQQRLLQQQRLQQQQQRHRSPQPVRTPSSVVRTVIGGGGGGGGGSGPSALSRPASAALNQLLATLGRPITDQGQSDPTNRHARPSYAAFMEAVPKLGGTPMGSARR